MTELSVEHVLMFVIVAFLIYHLVGGCSCGDGFNVGGQKGPCSMYDTYVWAGSTPSLEINKLGPQVNRMIGDDLANNYMSKTCRDALETNCSNIKGINDINKCVVKNKLWGVIDTQNQKITNCGPQGSFCTDNFIGNTCIGYDTKIPGCGGSDCELNPNKFKQYICDKRGGGRSMWYSVS